MRGFRGFLVLVLLFSHQAAAGINATIQPTRVSGVAPLATLFDASATTAATTSNPFHELEYRWDFGDTGCGCWVTGGTSKNVAFGPMAGHVFDSPGVSHAVLTVSGGAEVGVDSVTITVEDPDVVFAGTNTVCFSTAGDFTGAPSGALQTTTSFSEIMNHMGAFKRLPLRGAETWNAGHSGYLVMHGPGIVGAFGPGVDPDEYGIYATNPLLLGAVFSLADGIQIDPDTVNPYDSRFMDLRFQDTQNNPIFGREGEFHHVLFYRTKISGCTMAMSFPGSVLEYWNENYGQDLGPFMGVSVVQCRSVRRGRTPPLCDRTGDSIVDLS